MTTAMRVLPQLLPKPPAFSLAPGKEEAASGTSGISEKPQEGWEDLVPKSLMTSLTSAGPPAISHMGTPGQDRDASGSERPPGGWEGGGGQGSMSLPLKAEPSSGVGGLGEERRRRRVSETPQKTFFTHAEKVLLTRLVEKHRNGLFASNIRNKAETWRQLADMYNAQPGVFPREPKQLKKCWENMKCRGIISPILLGERPRIRRFPRPLTLKPRPPGYAPPTMVPIRSAIPQSTPPILPTPSSMGMTGQEFSAMASPRLTIAGQLRVRAAGLISSARAMGMNVSSLGMDVSPQHALVYSSAPSFGGLRLPFPLSTSQGGQLQHDLKAASLYCSLSSGVPAPPPATVTSPTGLPLDVPVVKIEPPDSDSPTPSSHPSPEAEGFALPVSVSSLLLSPHGATPTPADSTSVAAPTRLEGGGSSMRLPVMGAQSPSHAPSSLQPPPSPPSLSSPSPSPRLGEEGEDNQDGFSESGAELTVSDLEVRLLRRKLECLEREHEARMRVLHLQEEYWRLQTEAVSQHSSDDPPPPPSSHVMDASHTDEDT